MSAELDSEERGIAMRATVRDVVEFIARFPKITTLKTKNHAHFKQLGSL